MPKPFAKLNRADLQQAPVWEWLPDAPSEDDGEAGDESFVQATPHLTLPRAPFAQFIVAMTVGLKDGSCMPGIAEVTIADGQLAVQPTTVLLLDRHLPIPGVETNRLLARFTRTIANHPTTWKLDVAVDGETRKRAGKIKGGDMRNAVAAGLAVLMSLKSLRK